MSVGPLCSTGDRTHVCVGLGKCPAYLVSPCSSRTGCGSTLGAGHPLGRVPAGSGASRDHGGAGRAAITSPRPTWCSAALAMLMTVVFTAIHRRGRRPAAQPETGRHHLAARVPFLFSVVLAAVGPWCAAGSPSHRPSSRPNRLKKPSIMWSTCRCCRVFRRHPREPLIAVGARFADGGNYTAATITCSPCSSWPTSPNTLARPGAPR